MTVHGHSSLFPNGSCNGQGVCGRRDAEGRYPHFLFCILIISDIPGVIATLIFISGCR